MPSLRALAGLHDTAADAAKQLTAFADWLDTTPAD